MNKQIGLSLFLTLTMVGQAFADDLLQRHHWLPRIWVQAQVDGADGSATPLAADSRRWVDDTVDAMQRYYDQSVSYSADFVQIYETLDGIEKRSNGVVWFAKPGMMRWDYAKPEERYLISDGQTFWSWEPVYRQYCEQRLAESQLPMALSFLVGEGRIRKDFSVTLVERKESEAVLELVPFVASAAYAKIHFVIALPSARVEQAKVFDGMGNVNTLIFKSPELNVALDATLFRFSPPKDAQHICK